MSLLGIDVGTTGCKVIAFREDGEILAQAYGEYPLIHPQPGWSELDGNVSGKMLRMEFAKLQHKRNQIQLKQSAWRHKVKP